MRGTIGFVLLILPLALALEKDDVINAELVGMSRNPWRMYLVGQVLLNDQHEHRVAICSKYFTSQDAKVICNSLGYNFGHEIHEIRLPIDKVHKVLKSLNCVGKERSIDECPRKEIIEPEDCYHHENSKAVVLACKNINFDFSGSVQCGLNTGQTFGHDNEMKNDYPILYEIDAFREQTEGNPISQRNEDEPKLVQAAHEFPWTAKLYRLERNNQFIYQCGAALLTEDMIVTLAQCVEHIYNYVITVGEFDSESPSEFQVSYRLHSYSIHPDYENGKDKIGSNIAVVRLMVDQRNHDSKLKFSPSIIPVCLPTIFATLWGNIKGAVSDWAKEPLMPSALVQKTRYMRVVETPLWWPYKCKKHFGEQFVKGILCAGNTTGGDDACLWDDGAPLVTKLNGRAMLAGLLLTPGCGNGNEPRIYIDVQYHSKWIIKATKELAKLESPFVVYQRMSKI